MFQSNSWTPFSPVQPSLVEAVVFSDTIKNQCCLFISLSHYGTTALLNVIKLLSSSVAHLNPPCKYYRE